MNLWVVLGLLCVASPRGFAGMTRGEIDGMNARILELFYKLERVSDDEMARQRSAGVAEQARYARYDPSAFKPLGELSRGLGWAFVRKAYDTIMGNGYEMQRKILIRSIESQITQAENEKIPIGRAVRAKLMQHAELFERLAANGHGNGSRAGIIQCAIALRKLNR